MQFLKYKELGVGYSFKNLGDLGIEPQESGLGMQEKWKDLENE